MSRSGWVTEAQEEINCFVELSNMSLLKWHEILKTVLFFVFFLVFFWKEPERNVHEIHPSGQRMVRNATSSWVSDGRLQRQVLENPSPWADPSHHLQQKQQINQADTQESLHFFLTFRPSLTCPNRIEILAKDLGMKEAH